MTLPPRAAQLLSGAMLVLAAVAGLTESTQAQTRILVYTRNYTPDGKGYVHDNIAASVAAIQKIGAEKGMGVDVSDDPTVFTDPNLKKYAALVFSNSNNEAFASQDQRDAFQRYIRAGGGFVGIHSASGSQRDWPYFWQVMGGKFVVHPKQQTFKVTVVDTQHVATKGLPAEFDWFDECYFVGNLNPGLHPMLVVDRTKLEGLEKIDVANFPNPMPLAWWQKFDGGREVYIAIGHNKEEYAKPTMVTLITNAITFAATR